jgi:hypothetical protein
MMKQNTIAAGAVIAFLLLFCNVGTASGRPASVVSPTGRSLSQIGEVAAAVELGKAAGEAAKGISDIIGNDA